MHTDILMTITYGDIAISVILLIVILTAVIVRKPNEFRVARSILIAAPEETIFPRINTLREWENWSPWTALDPQAQITYEGPPSGVDATMRWAGNRKMGEGSLTIIHSQPYETMRYRLEFIKPFSNTCTAEFNLRPENGQTRVEWSMYGKNSVMGKVVSLFMNCEKMVGNQLDAGLKNIKTLTEN